MQRYERDNHLVWSGEKLAVLRRRGEGGMVLDVGDGVGWLERAEEAVVLGHVLVMEAGGVRLPEKLIRRFRAMLVVLEHHPPLVQTTLYYLRAVLNATIGYHGMHLPYWRGQLEEVEGEVQRLIRGHEGILTEVPWCVLRWPTAYCKVFVQPIFSFFSVQNPDIRTPTENHDPSTVLDSVGISGSGIPVAFHSWCFHHFLYNKTEFGSATASPEIARADPEMVDF